MKVVSTFLFAVAVTLNSIELSSQSDVTPYTKGFPGYSSSARQQSPERTSPEKRLLLGRTSSPEGRAPSFEVFGYTLEQLGYLRLIPCTNLSIIFEFRRYIIPAGKPISVRAGSRYVPVPARKYIVVSASNGDIFALLQYSGVLRGIYGTTENHSRVKINMISGAVKNMTADEVRDCPIDEIHPIFPHTFIKVVRSSGTLDPECSSPSKCNLGSSSSSSSAKKHSPDLPFLEDRPLRIRSRSPRRDPPDMKY